MAVPFAYDVAPAFDRPRKIAAICHIFYVDLGQEMLGYLMNLPEGTDLYISTTDQEKAAVLRDIFASWTKGRVEIRVVANRGRDIAPKLITFQDVYDAGYELILFLHSKKTEREDTGPTWRLALLETLAGSRETVGSVLAAFDGIPSLGMVLPQHHQTVRRHSSWQNNFLHGRRLAKAMGFPLKSSYRLDFAAGSMFWLRPQAIRPLLNLHLRLEDFPEENRQIGDTIAHAIERLMLFVCEFAGYTWVKIADPRFFAPQQTVQPICREEELAGFLAAHPFSLLPNELHGTGSGGYKASPRAR